MIHVPSPDTLEAGERHRLLRLARQAIEARVQHHAPPAIDENQSGTVCYGAFVTIYHRGQLRGCLGRLGEAQPLVATIVHLGTVVCDSDPRFSPVTSAELCDIEVEISVLSPERKIAGAQEIEVGRHGLIVERGGRCGLLLPQVAVEHGWDAETFLVHTCLKAGLPPDAWRHGADVYVFEAQVFGDAARGLSE